ncbi:GDSL-type esterase/lipase family protein [Lactobacillus kalixensis]|uniref:Esterase n=1 Tax=Lactobacillus kalixensis DSM 16043 TaxID=1423763 RepID=A0A0R1U879_9LACO|nr:GDSL-type esterase/lipase family protein [Lactobacillus kalixensis]KRL88820.1 esterase [Lactobacillus kalixensis DSM 16043]
MKVLLTGDSIIARYEGKSEPYLNYELEKKLPGITLTNTAVSGINSGAYFARLSELVLKQSQHDVLIILLGTNDLAMHKQVPLHQFKNNMELIASAIVCQYWPKYVILVSPSAVDEKKQHVRSNDLVKEYGQVVNEVADEYHFHFVDLGQKMLDQGNLEQLCQGQKNDGLHFGQAGYDLLSDLLVQELQKIK